MFPPSGDSSDPLLRTLWSKRRAGKRRRDGEEEKGLRISQNFRHCSSRWLAESRLELSSVSRSQVSRALEQEEFSREPMEVVCEKDLCPKNGRWLETSRGVSAGSSEPCNVVRDDGRRV